MKPFIPSTGQSESRGPTPTAWRVAQEISLSSGPIRAGDSEESVRKRIGEPIEYEVPLDPDVKIELPGETVRAIKKIDTFFQAGKWFRVSMWRKVPHRPYVFRWKGYEEPAHFVVYRVEVPSEHATASKTATPAASAATANKSNNSVAATLTRHILETGTSVRSIVVRGDRIRVGDLTDDSVAYARASDRIAAPLVQGDPAFPGSLIVVQTYAIEGRKFCLESKRETDPGPYKVSRIVMAK